MGFAKVVSLECQEDMETVKMGPGMESMNPSHGWGLASCPKQWAVKLNGINRLTKCFVVFSGLLMCVDCSRVFIARGRGWCTVGDLSHPCGSHCCYPWSFAPEGAERLFWLGVSSGFNLFILRPT